jgi:hypothetical protein
MCKVEVYNRWNTFLYAFKNKNEMFVKIPCLECGGTGFWDYYPIGWKHKDGDTICVDCKGSGYIFIDVY